MKTTQDQAAGWATVTDVPCPCCKHGIVRWAEAGYAPGWRECDMCGRQFMGDPATGRLSQRRGPTHRCTAKRVAAVVAARAATAQRQAVADSRLAADAGRSDAESGSFHGREWHALSGYYDAGEADGRQDRLGPKAVAYWRSWIAAADPRAVAVAERLPANLILPGTGRGRCGHWRPRVLAISRDGTQVVIYRDGCGGTYRQTLAAALAGILVGE